MLPECLARLQIKGIQGGLFSGSEVQKHAITRDDRRGAIAPDVMLLAEICAFPQFLAIQVITKNTGAGEEDHDLLAIRGRRCPAIRVRAMREFRLLVGRARFPELLACFAVKAQQQPLPGLLHGLGHEDLVTPHHRRGVSAIRQGHLPHHVLRLAPLFGQTRLRGGAVPVRAAPHGPVGGRAGGCDEGTEGTEQEECAFHAL